jgi:hypothetical protein
MPTWIKRAIARSLPVVLTLLLMGPIFSSNSPAASLHYFSLGKGEYLIIFVHGIFGDAISTFKAPSSSKSWPELMLEDKRPMPYASGPSLSEYGIATIDFDASRDSRLSIEELSNQIITDLLDSGVFDRYKHIIFVAHSMGGS